MTDRVTIKPARLWRASDASACRFQIDHKGVKSPVGAPGSRVYFCNLNFEFKVRGRVRRNQKSTLMSSMLPMPQSVAGGARTYVVSTRLPCAPLASTDVRVSVKLPVGTAWLPALYAQLAAVSPLALQWADVSEEYVPGAGDAPRSMDTCNAWMVSVAS